MNYLILLGLALHFSHQISAEINCTSLSCPSGESCDSYKSICESTTGCEWDTADTFCESNDGLWQQSCCSPSITSHPSQNPTESPLQNPTGSPLQNPTGSPLQNPTGSPLQNPTGSPLQNPTESPLQNPTGSPLQNPTGSPLQNPTEGRGRGQGGRGRGRGKGRGGRTKGPSLSPSFNTNSSSTSEPSHQPTMQSAVKWEMVHPEYDGGDGELLWRVYYGDLSTDERFDDYRKKEMWHVQELTTIINSDDKLYEMVLDSGKGTETGTASKTETVYRYRGWLILVAMLASCMFGFWYKCKSSSSKILNYNGYESKPLLNEKTVSDETYQAIN